MKAWHFVGNTLRDGRPVPADGEWLAHNDEVVLGEAGLHASLDPFDTLQYAPGPILCRVELRGVIVRGEDKVAASQRRIIKRRDMTAVLRYFARMQALSVIHLCDPCPPDVVLDYLMTGDEQLREAAWVAAWDVARGAVWDVAWVAVRAAARADAAADAAARAAADAAARAAAKAAADAAVWAAADAATKNAVWAAADAATKNAVWDAAWARGAASAEFNALVRAEFA